MIISRSIYLLLLAIGFLIAKIDASVGDSDPFYSGQKVVIEEKHEGQPAAEITVIIQGLTPSGYLLATDEDNKSYELHPDGNSFDFFKGLVMRKLG